jgi:phosphatidylglycerol:prolipoprotein diacylglycerol transferase
VYPNLFRFPEWVPLLGGEFVTTFGLMMFLSFVVGGLLIRAELERKGHDPDKAWDFVFMAVIGGIVGAKMYYVLLNYERLMAAPAELIFSRGGMVWYGGFLGATALVVWEVKRSKLPIGQMADAIGPALAAGYAVGRMGCFLVGDDWGRPTALPWGIRFPQGTPPTTVAVIEREFGIQVDPALIARFGDVLPVHPTQLYEVAISTLIFLVLWKIRDHRRQAGWIFALWLALAGAERFFVEIFRAKDDRFIGPLTVAQVISIGLIVVGAIMAARLSARAPAEPQKAAAPKARADGAKRRSARKAR